MKILSVITLLSLVVFGFTQPSDYTAVVNLLKASINDQAGKYYHAAYKNLGRISDTYGPRLWGSQALQKTILDVYKQAKDAGFDKVHFQAVKNFTKWQRGIQSLTLLSPRPFPTKLKLIGLGGTVKADFEAQAIVVSSFDQLEQKKDLVKDKIVVYNQQWSNYDQTVSYRATGAVRAAKYGAKAALVRSITPYSISSVHAGIQHYNPLYPKIPVAAITLEDAQMLHRMYKRGQKIVLELRLQNSEVANTYSNNIIFEITGSKYPDEIILMGGHIDSWDTGSQTGTNDDAGGFLSCFEALRLIKDLLPRPKRTLRFIAWSGEEWGNRLDGARTYILTHRSELKNHILAFQDDLGSTKLMGFGYSGNTQGRDIVSQITDRYMNIVDAGQLIDDGEAVDTEPLLEIGIPTMANKVKDNNKNQFYYTYHHTAGDSLTMMSADDLDSNVLGIASMFYIIADLDQSIQKPTINQEALNKIIESIEKAKRNPTTS